ncbi:hypothetical protein OJF2_05930 [Aquisphaera giovannonii]|uniref:Carboxymuconolactone decarboxylase family protein n=1 Tax=Aquisphaera giovannonii TaxID=406548 RepID=A0A5B9VVM2_9BACT|nr:hypothetical protein [Aquisphaera giovannonii]QEH32124.1 hypothetical protein OJF2_05930 [Aquisphaera giovannonii]
MSRLLWPAAILAAAMIPIPARAESEPSGRWPVATNEEAWAHLPKALSGGGSRLPAWARATAEGLPRTTAAMLGLDRRHRTMSPLGASLRGKMRWVAADANRCEYTRATAEADLRRAGVPEAEVAALKGGPGGWAQGERDALRFARQMTVDASAVTDAQVERIKAAYGEEKLAAMVLLLAAANFQDRLVLGLGIPPEEGGPLPPVDVTFEKDSKPEVPPREKPEGRRGPDEPTAVDDPSWMEFDFDALKKGLADQKAAPGRVRVPTYQEYLAKLPEWAPRPKAPVRIKWSLVCGTYQPELAAAWSACTNAFREEAKQDRVFEESLFWIVTRTIHCFY